MLRYLQKRYVRARLTAYIDGELNPASRRFVARLIDEHSDLYADYMTLRETRRNLERELPLIGRIDTHQMNNMWANINAQLQTEEALSAPPQSHRTPEPRFSFSYGMAVIIFVACVRYTHRQRIHSSRATRATVASNSRDTHQRTDG